MIQILLTDQKNLFMKTFLFPLLLMCGLLLVACNKQSDELQELTTTENAQFRFGEEGDCEECITPAFAEIRKLTTRSAAFHWAAPDSQGPNPDCGYFLVTLVNTATGASADFSSIASPFTFDNLLPCTEYEAVVSHVTNLCASAPARITFTTACYCEPSSDYPFHLFFDNLILAGENLTIREPYTDYLNWTNQTFYFNSGPHTMAANITANGPWSGPISVKLWVDLNQDGAFADPAELLHSQQYSVSGVGGPNYSGIVMGPFNFPATEDCGLTARLMMSNDPNMGPCSTVTVGQTLDFTIHASENCDFDPI